MPLQDIQTRISAAEAAAGCAPGSTVLIAVSKVQPNDRVQAVLEQGHRCFGENRVQEAASKWPAFRQWFDGVALHLIGPLQTNKARQAVELCDAIHTLDRPKLAHTLARLAQERGSSPDLFIQVNTGEEAQKAGVLPSHADAFVAECRGLGPADPRIDVHPPGGRGTGAAFCPAGQDRRTQRAVRPFDGHEFGFRNRDCFGCDPYSGRFCDIW